MLPGAAQAVFRSNYVDHRLTAAREWRDVYRYDPRGDFLGWTRHGSDEVQSFNHEGLLVVETDKAGRCVVGKMVRYDREFRKGPGPIPLTALRVVVTETAVRYAFAGADDWRGQRVP